MRKYKITTRISDLYRKDPPGNIKLSGQKVKKKHDIGVVSKYSSPNKIFVNYKGKYGNLTMEKPSRFHLN